MRPPILFTPPNVILNYDMNIIGKTAVLSGRKQFGRENPEINFYNYFLDNEEGLYSYCIDAFFLDADNNAAHNIMHQAISTAPADLRAAIVTYYRS